MVVPVGLAAYVLYVIQFQVNEHNIRREEIREQRAQNAKELLIRSSQERREGQ